MRAHVALGLMLVIAVLAVDQPTLVAAPAVADRIAFVREPLDAKVDDIGDVYLMNVDGSGQRNLTRSQAFYGYPTWSPDRRKIVVAVQDRARGGWATNVFVVSAERGGRQQLTQTPWSDSPVWSPDGRRIAFIRHFLYPPGNVTGYTTSEIYVMNADGSGQRRLTRNKLNDEQLSWSRTGKLVFVRSPRLAPEAWTQREIFDMKPDGSGLRRLTRNALRDDAVAPSPDGRRLAFVRWRGRLSALYVMNADGTRSRRLTPTIDATDFVSDPPGLVWSPSGKKIAFTWGVQRDIYVINADGSGLRKVAGGHPGWPTWSADGRKIAFARHPAIYVVDADGTGERRLVPKPGRTEFSLGANWSPSWHG